MRAGLALALLLLLLTASCKDVGVERHKQALEQYTDCANRRVPPSDLCFTEVLAILETVPKSSSARPRADALRDGLLTARRPKLRSPLAVQGGPRLPPEVTLLLQQCQRLAEQLGALPEAERRKKLLELDACREKAERLDAKHAHGEEDGGTH